MLLGHPLTVLNLTVRASNCLSDVPTLSALLEYPESQLIRQRHFGRTSLADVRRKVVHFCVDHLGVGPSHPIRVALYDPHPAISAVWNAPPQARTYARTTGRVGSRSPAAACDRVLAPCPVRCPITR